MIKNTKSNGSRLLRAFILATPIALGGCASYQRIDHDSCNEWQETFLGVPEMIKIFEGKNAAVSSELCSSGRKIGYSALFARAQTGELHPASLIMWQREYQKLMDKISVRTPDEATELLKIKKFADYFIEEGSTKFGKSLVTSQMAGTMFEKKILDPSQFTPMGEYVPNVPGQKPAREKVCTGKDMLRYCAPQTQPSPDTPSQQP